MKKIGIVTITKNPNYGNSLQMIAMQYVLRDLGYAPETIKNYDGSTLFINQSNIKYHMKVFLNRNGARRLNVRRKRFCKCLSHHIKFSKAYWLGSEMKKFVPDYFDYYIVGSDQVWNPFFGMASDFEMLRFVPNQKRIAYAASTGIESFEGLDSNRIKQISKSLKDFKSISVREEAGAEIIRQYTRKETPVCIDPTMLLTVKQWDTILEKPELKLPKKYLAVYMLGNITEEYRKEIEEIANAHGAKPINLLNDEFFYLNPLEFVWIIKNSCFVCTDSFHATVFSILYHREFKIYNRKDRHRDQNSRFKTLLKKCGIQSIETIDWNEVEINLTKERVKSADYLKNALGETE